MEEQQFEYMANLLEQQLRHLETITTELVRLNDLLQQVFTK